MAVKIRTLGTLVRGGIHRAAAAISSEGDPNLAALLDEIATGQPVQVPLFDGQSGRGPRVAISQAATRRGLTVEMVKWEGFVALRKLDEPADPEGEVDGCDRRTTTTGPATPA